MREQECLRCQHDRQMLVHEDERSKASLRRARSASGLTLLREATDREFMVHKVRLIFLKSKRAASPSVATSPLSNLLSGRHEPKVTAQHLHGYNQSKRHKSPVCYCVRQILIVIFSKTINFPKPVDKIILDADIVFSP